MPPKRATRGSARIASGLAQDASAASTRGTAKEKDSGKVAPTDTGRHKKTRTWKDDSRTSAASRKSNGTDKSSLNVEKSEFDLPSDSDEAQPQIPIPMKTPVNRRPPQKLKKATQTLEQKKAIEGLQARMRAAKGGQAAQPATDVREVSQQVARDSEKQDRRRDSAKEVISPKQVTATVPNSTAKAPPSALKFNSTPAVESSILALANFKRRRRQPSLLQMVQQGDIGQDSTDFSLDDDLDFAPHDESTPLNATKLPTATRQATPPMQQDDEDLYGLSPRPRGRKRKSDEMQNEAEATSTEQVEQEDEAEEHSEPRRPDPIGETFADPMSSSPIPPSSPSLSARTPSPGKRRKIPPKHLTTANLRALLPKRRVHLTSSPGMDNTDFSIPSSNDVVEDDYRPGRRKVPPKNSKRQTANAKSSKAAPKTTRTYGKQSSDKENEGSTSSLSELVSEEDAMDKTKKRTAISKQRSRTDPLEDGDELIAARKKFQAVDEWEMEFDSASLGGGGDSSPWR